jgi:hypothetical protein
MIMTVASPNLLPTANALHTDSSGDRAGDPQHCEPARLTIALVRHHLCEALLDPSAHDVGMHVATT